MRVVSDTLYVCSNVGRAVENLVNRQNLHEWG